MAVSDASPRATPAPSSAPVAPVADEISLRELYLVVRRALPLIVGAAVLAGVVAFAVLASRPAHYVAESSTVVARTPVDVTGAQGLAYRPELDVTYETYSTVAFSRVVLEAVLLAVPEADLTPARARDAMTLERLSGSANQAVALLAVAHRVQAASPEVAASLATRWAEVTVQMVRELMIENLDAVEQTTRSELASARSALEQVEADVLAFRLGADDEAVDAVLANLRQRSISLDARRDDLLRVRVSVLADLASLADEDPAANTVLAHAPEVVVTVADARRALAGRAAAYAAELELLDEQAAAIAREMDELRPVAEQRRSTELVLERAAAQARSQVAMLAAIEPTVAYVAQLAPTGARVLADAAVPTAPEPRSALLVALLAAVVVGFGGVVVALLAEAVRDPARAAR